MATLTFDSFSTSSRRKPMRGAPPALPAPVALPLREPDVPTHRLHGSTALLVGLIVAAHAGAVFTLAGAKRAPAVVASAVPITISLAPPKVEPPPPPPAMPEPPAPRPKAVAPRVAAPRQAPAPAPAQAPLVAADTPLVAASADTVQVARAPVDVPTPPAAPKAEEAVTEPKGYAGYLRNPAPDYPPAAQKRGLEGKVVLKVHVLASGQPDTVTIATSSGHQILDDAALKAVTQWAFAPARRGQTPIDGWVQVPLTFKI